MGAKVTVVIPTYNQAEYLGEALESLLRQTFKCWEAIVINNYSTDHTAEIIKFHSDPRIKIINFKNGGAIACSRNLGIRLSSSKYIAFLDSDDIWFANKLDMCLRRIESGYDLVCHAELWMTGKNRKYVRYGTGSKPDYDSLLFEGNRISTSAVMMSRSLLEEVKGFDERVEFITAEDYDLWLRCARHGARLAFLSEPMGIYRLHEGSNSSKISSHVDAVRCVLDSHFSSIGPVNGKMAKRIRARKALLCYEEMRLRQTQGDYERGWPLFLKAVALNPYFLRAYLGLGYNIFLTMKRFIIVR